MHQHRTWTELDLEAIRRNARLIKQQVAPAGMLAVVKAGAYGHGAPQVARALAGIASGFAVANLQEGLELRSAGVDGPIVLLSPCLPQERAPAVAAGFVPTVSSSAEAQAYRTSDASPISVHFKIDSGMGRVGAWRENGVRELRDLAAAGEVDVAMVSTHLPSVQENPEQTLEQLRWFGQAVGELRAVLPDARFHALNSAGILAFPQFALDLVRPGLLLYGVNPLPGEAAGFCPALTWRARVALVREVPVGRTVSYGGHFVTRRPSRLALLAVGYADGYFRQLDPNKACVLLRGRRCPVIGRVTMDQVIVDATDLPALEVGEVATLLGRDGNEEISASEFADWAGTIPWHVLTAIGPRVARLTESDTTREIE